MNSILMATLHGTGREVKDFLELLIERLDQKVIAERDAAEAAEWVVTCQAAEKNFTEVEAATKVVATEAAARSDVANKENDDSRADNFEKKGVADNAVMEAEEFEDADEREAELKKAGVLKDIWIKAKERWDTARAEAARCTAESDAAEAAHAAALRALIDGRAKLREAHLRCDQLESVKTRVVAAYWVLPSTPWASTGDPQPTAKVARSGRRAVFQ